MALQLNNLTDSRLCGLITQLEAKMKEIIPGCGNCNSYTSVCRIMFDNPQQVPTYAQETLIDPPGAIEGPPSPGVPGLICKAATNPELQKDCSHFIVRTENDNIRDANI